MQRTTGFEQLTDAELIRAAQYGDTWAREQLIGAYQPLVHALAARALDGRPGSAAAVHAVVRDTLSRAEFALGTLPSPDAFRPWLVAIGIASTLAHATGLPAHPAPPAPPGSGLTDALPWLDIEDSVLAALWSLEEEGHLSPYETSAALNWTPQDTAMRREAVRLRLAAAQSVTTALTRAPRCPALQDQAATWDGHPSAAWRDELARHTTHCAYCATGFGAATHGGARVAPVTGVPGVVAPAGFGAAAATDFETFAPTDFGAAAPEYGDAVTPPEYGDAATPPEYGAVTATDFSADAPTATYGAVLHDVNGYPTPAEREAVIAAAGRRSTRATRRRRRQTDERNRRRAVVAAGMAVVAVTGGAFSLHATRGGNEDLLEANRASAPDLDLPLANEPGTLTASPSTTSATPSTSASPTQTPGTPKRPTATPSKAPRSTTAAPATKRPTTPAPTTKAPTPKKTAPTGGTDDGPGGGTQHDTGQSSAADKVIALVNAERAKAGCGALTANATLNKAAQGHSDDMAARDFFDHTNPDGAGPGERVTAAGYPWSTYGENIAMGQSTPEQVMESWMNSPGHRANILNCDFKEIGIGIHTSGGPYWTQVFGAR
ncbi:CAP domain-containing protein [Streptomyces sp. NPDC059534]|uniref:CAP domain-containing protein n=1 Tax=Streptomyces sp. NPDC059534 TaxID=3346859 RepID=UPI003698C26F